MTLAQLLTIILPHKSKVQLGDVWQKYFMGDSMKIMYPIITIDEILADEYTDYRENTEISMHTFINQTFPEHAKEITKFFKR